MMIEKGIKGHFDKSYILRDMVVVWIKTHWQLVKRFYMELRIYLTLMKLALSNDCKAPAVDRKEDYIFQIRPLVFRITFMLPV